VIEIVRPGPLATVQDLGRPGYAHLGVGRSGAADRGSLRLANRLVGNPETAAGLEVTLGGFTVRFTAPALVALTGARCPATLAARATHLYGPVAVAAGDELVLGSPDRGVRTYLAVRGGIDVPAVFGSRATDLLGGLGPPALQPGTRLPVGTATDGFPTVDLAPVPEPGLTLPVRPGPRADWFAAGALDDLAAAAYAVTAESNRVGLRLDGPPLRHREQRELPTEGLVEGSLQVPPSGQPILMLADHPVTGGYPVIAVLDEAAIGAAAQARPGDRLRFTVRG
jgi:biotin-dependent carboxylase-like uncharacterized protein